MEEEEKEEKTSQRQNSKGNLRSCQRKGKRESEWQSQAFNSAQFLTNSVFSLPTLFLLNHYRLILDLYQQYR